jgi:hypothetical protein
LPEDRRIATDSWIKSVVTGIVELSIGSVGAGQLDESTPEAGDWGFPPAGGEIVALPPPSF